MDFTGENSNFHWNYFPFWYIRSLRDRPQTNYPLQRLPNVEERLLQLEGDKDSLHLQVRARPSR